MHQTAGLGQKELSLCRFRQRCSADMTSKQDVALFADRALSLQYFPKRNHNFFYLLKHINLHPRDSPFGQI